MPANRFEVLECKAARDAVLAGELDGERLKQGGLDVLAQHVLGMACAAPFDADALFAEVRSASPYAHLTRADFDAVVDFVATGGYALKRYDRYARLRKTPDGKWRLAHPRLAQQYRLNVGVIVEDPMVDIRLQAKGRPTGAGGRRLGQLEEYFIEQLAPGDTFVFAGDVLRFEGLREDAAYVTRTQRPGSANPQSYNGGKFPLSTFLAQRVREMVSTPERWHVLPDPVQEWLRIQEWRRVIPQARPVAGGDLSARHPALSGLLSVRGPAGAPDPGHAADAAAGAAAHAAAGLCRQRICAGGLGARDMGGARHGQRCSTRTCWATIWMPGWPNPISTSAPSAIAPSSPA